MRRIPTFVLDTNAWLDLLVFADPALDGFVATVNRGDACVAVDRRALAELARVLGYPALQLDDTVAAMHLARATELSQEFDVMPMPLPRCRDRDDQMFLEIAVAARAVALLTRDDELLRMTGRMAREYGVAVVPPSAWRAHCDAA
jgi:putative PIN family toxin of toxin-antitoxin system